MDILDQFHADINTARQAQSDALTKAGEKLGEAFDAYQAECNAATMAFARTCANIEGVFETQLGMRRMAFMGELEPLPIMPRSSVDPDTEAKSRVDESRIDAAAEKALDLEALTC